MLATNHKPIHTWVSYHSACTPLQRLCTAVSPPPDLPTNRYVRIPLLLKVRYPTLVWKCTLCRVKLCTTVERASPSCAVRLWCAQHTVLSLAIFSLLQ